MEKDQVIEDYEIHLTQKILSFGFNIKCLLPEYNTIDYRNGHEDINPHSDCGDPLSYKRYFGRTVHPYEGIFVKTNRALYDIDYLDSLSASMLIPSLPSKSLLESSPVLKLYVKKLQQINCTKKQNSRFSMRILRWAEKKITRSICRDLS